MTTLIDEFKKEHSEIVAALKEVKELGLLTKEGKFKRLSLKASFTCLPNVGGLYLYQLQSPNLSSGYSSASASSDW